MKLKKWRILNKIKAAEICETLGICRQALSKYENGQRFPRPEIQKRISKMTKGKVGFKDLFAEIKAKK